MRGSLHRITRLPAATGFVRFLSCFARGLFPGGGIQMADGTGPGRVSLSGVVFAALLLILIVASLYFFIAQPFWFPKVASEHGKRIDSLFMAVLVVSGIAFVLVQGALGFFVARYGSN